MLLGLTLIVIVGLLWTGVGVLQGLVAQARESSVAFYAVGTGLAAVLAWIISPEWSATGGLGRTDLLGLGVIALAAAANALGQILVVSAMRHGPQGLTLALVQAAVTVPFLFSCGYWGERPSAWAWVGVGLLLFSLFFLARGKSAGTPGATASGRWLGLAAGAVLAVGLTQTLLSVPSHWADFADPARLRVPVYLTAGALGFGLAVWWRGLRPSRRLWSYGTVWAGLAVASHTLCFRCLDLLAEIKLTALVFPGGMGVSLIAFAAYCHLARGERYAPVAKLGLGCCLAGVLLMALR